jgi:hypothetical protein
MDEATTARFRLAVREKGRERLFIAAFAAAGAKLGGQFGLVGVTVGAFIGLALAGACVSVLRK